MKRSRVYLSQPEDLTFLNQFQDQISPLMSILESSYDGIYITDGAANTIWINESYAVISGLAPSEVIGLNMKEMEGRGIVSQSATLLALERREAVTVDQTFKTGKRAVVTSSPIFDQNDEIVMVVTNVRDVSQLYNLQRELAQKQELAQQYQNEIELIRRQLLGNTDMVAVAPSMLALLRVVRRVCQLDTVVLILGETGAGKERIATYIHQNSPRQDKPFIRVNCSTIPDNLAESELFGYERGAFTGANREGRPGMFEVANHGTIFLDEIGELPLHIQTKLLRVLQEQEITRVGSSVPIKIDVRVLAATNRNLKELVSRHLFREDLFYRLNVFPISVPPLRERRADIPVLAEYMLRHLNQKYNTDKIILPAAMQELETYDWPGNVRELRNIIERAFIMCDGRELSSFYFVLRERDAAACAEAGEQNIDLKEILEKKEQEYIENAYAVHKNMRAAARSLNMDPATYLRKQRKYREKYPFQK